MAFGKLEEGYESAIKDYYKKQIAQLNNLVKHVTLKFRTKLLKEWDGLEFQY